MEVPEVRGEVLTTSSGAGRQVMKLHGYKRRRVWDRPLWSVMCMGQGVRRGLVTATDQWSKGGGWGWSVGVVRGDRAWLWTCWLVM